MARYRFLCPSCGMGLVVRPSAIGHSIKCWHCEAQVTVPTPEEDAANRSKLAQQRIESYEGPYRRPAAELVDAADGADFLNVIGVCAIVFGIIAVLAGCMAVPFLAGLGAALLFFVLATFAFVISGIARNVYAMALRLDKMRSDKPQGE